jgi:hypothetical protein
MDGVRDKYGGEEDVMVKPEGKSSLGRPRHGRDDSTQFGVSFG